MATLVNYSVSTFRDCPNPNKRRLQELQHSEARAHAARVAYWRKKKPGTSSSGRDKSLGEHAQQDSVSTASSTSPKNLKQRSTHESTAEVSGQWTRIVFEEPARTSEAAVSNDSEPSSQTAISHSSATPNRARQSSASEADSPDDGKDTDGWEHTHDYFKVPRHPSSRLFDPLDSIPCTQGDEVVAAMDHYMHSWAPSQRPGLKYQTKDNPLIRDVFPAALQNVELFEATVALCLSFKAASQGLQSRVFRKSLHHKGQALVGIRNKLTSGAVDEAVILATVFLMIIDNVFYDVRAYEAHLHGLRKMVKANLASHARRCPAALLPLIAWAESNAILMFDGCNPSESSVPDAKLHYPSQPFSKMETQMMAALTPGFRTMAIAGHLSLQVVSILDNTIRWTSSMEYGHGPQQAKLDQTFLVGYDPRSNSAQAMTICRVPSEKHAMERTVCKVLYVYHANLLNWSSRCAGYLRIISELAEDMGSREVEDVEMGAFWSWTAMVTANAARRAGLKHVQADLMAQFMVLHPEARTWESVQAGLKRFLSHGGLEREWQMCWETATDTKSAPR